MTLQGILAEFDKPEEVSLAASLAVKQGYRSIDAFTPYHVEGLAEILGAKQTPVPLMVLGGGIAGGLTGYLLQWFCDGVNYPLNVGGRPFNSIPSFIPITFELTILFASFAALIAMFYLNGLPRPWRPVFTAEIFRRASKDGFFLWIESRDPLFHPERTRAFLESLKAKGVHEIEV